MIQSADEMQHEIMRESASVRLRNTTSPGKAFEDFWASIKLKDDEAVKQIIKEAFMAGVAWGAGRALKESKRVMERALAATGGSHD